MTRHPRLFSIRANRASNLLEEFPTGPVSFSELLQISTASASRLKAYDLALQLLRTAATATLQIIKTGSTTYKPHRLPRGAASFKSLYLKRAPPEHLDSTTCREMGAPDRARRLLVSMILRASTFVLLVVRTTFTLGKAGLREFVFRGNFQPRERTRQCSFRV